jgi:hypothetical protein
MERWRAGGIDSVLENAHPVVVGIYDPSSISPGSGSPSCCCFPYNSFLERPCCKTTPSSTALSISVTMLNRKQRHSTSSSAPVQRVQALTKLMSRSSVDGRRRCLHSLHTLPTTLCEKIRILARSKSRADATCSRRGKPCTVRGVGTHSYPCT